MSQFFTFNLIYKLVTVFLDFIKEKKQYSVFTALHILGEIKKQVSLNYWSEVNLFVYVYPFNLKAFSGRNRCTSFHLIQIEWWKSVQPLEYKKGNDNLDRGVFLQTLIRENSWFNCEDCDYMTKYEKELKIHIGKMHELSQNSAKEIY